MATSPDGKYLAMAIHDDGVALYEIASLLAADKNTVPTPLAVRSTHVEGALKGAKGAKVKGAGTIEVAFSADGTFLAASDEWLQRVAVFNVSDMASGNKGLVGHLPAGINPVGIVALPGADGRQRIAYTSQRDPEAAKGAAKGGTKGAAKGVKSGPVCSGTIRVADLKDMAIVKRHDVGCSPVRVDVTPAGDLAATARGENAVALVTASGVVKIPTGANPVGVRFADRGKHLVVAASNRFGNANGEINIVQVASKTVVKTLPTLVFPRTVAVDPTTTLAVVTLYGSSSVDVVHLPSVLTT